MLKYLFGYEAPERFRKIINSPSTSHEIARTLLHLCEELLVKLDAVVDERDVASAVYRTVSFKGIANRADVESFRECVVGFRAFVASMPEEEYGMYYVPVLFTCNNGTPHYTTAAGEAVRYSVFPHLAPYVHRETTLGDVLEFLAPRAWRFMRAPAVEGGDAADAGDAEAKDDGATDAGGERAGGEEPASPLRAYCDKDKTLITTSAAEKSAHVRNALALFKRCKFYSRPAVNTYVSYNYRFTEVPIELPAREGGEGAAPTPEEALNEVLNTPLSHWLRPGSKLVIRFPSDVLPGVDLKEGDRLHVPEHMQEKTATLRKYSRNKATTTLVDCIQAFLTKETLEEAERWYCDRCKEHQRAEKQFFMWRAPPILIVHLKRFEVEGYRRERNDTVVDFPISGLDLSPYVLDRRSDGPHGHLYDLYAVSNHSGTLNGGHYTAFAKCPETGAWHKFDDSCVSEVHNTDDIVTSAAYVLFYCRRDLATSVARDLPPVAAVLAHRESAAVRTDGEEDASASASASASAAATPANSDPEIFETKRSIVGCVPGATFASPGTLEQVMTEGERNVTAYAATNGPENAGLTIQAAKTRAYGGYMMYSY